jgi:hypothetical protein
MRLTDRLWFSSTSFNWQELDIFWRPMDLRSLGELDWPTVVQFHLIQLTGTGYIVAAHGFAITWGAWLTDCGSVTAQFIDSNWTDTGRSFFCDPLGWLCNLRRGSREIFYSVNWLTFVQLVYLRLPNEIHWPTVVQFHLILLTGTGYILAAHGFAITWGAWLTDCGSVTAQFIDRNWTDSGRSFFCDPLGWLCNLRRGSREIFYSVNWLTFVQLAYLRLPNEFDWPTVVQFHLIWWRGTW